MPANAAAAPKPTADNHGKIALISADPGLRRGASSSGARLVGVGMVKAGLVSSVLSVVSVDPVVVEPRLVLVVDPPLVVEVVEPDEVVVDGRVVDVGTSRVVVVV
ncbi:MAG TPA: hypothetical protein VMY88_08730 [Acidimicrobiales bacterium]|nr:hypothetical protein [Acidimicrobiales bacterium]